MTACPLKSEENIFMTLVVGYFHPHNIRQLCMSCYDSFVYEDVNCFIHTGKTKSVSCEKSDVSLYYLTVNKNDKDCLMGSVNDGWTVVGIVIHLHKSLLFAHVFQSWQFKHSNDFIHKSLRHKHRKNSIQYSCGV